MHELRLLFIVIGTVACGARQAGIAMPTYQCMETTIGRHAQFELRDRSAALVAMSVESPRIGETFEQATRDFSVGDRDAARDLFHKQMVTRCYNRER